MNVTPYGRKKTTAIVLLVILSAALYARTLSFGFVYDDNTIILRNPWITDFSYLPEIFSSTVTSFHGHKSNTYRPMLFVILSLEEHLFGLKPWGFHLVNVILHVLNTVMVFIVASNLLSRGGLSGRVFSLDKAREILPPFVAGVLFAAHPVNTEAVSWASAVTEPFYTLMLLAAFHLHARAGDGARPPLALPLLCFIAAVLSKETAIVLPFLLAAYSYAVSDRDFLRRLKSTIPYFAVALIYLGVRTYVIGGIIHYKEEELGLLESFINIFPNIKGYFVNLILPVNLNALYVFHPVESIFSLKVIAGALIALAAILLLAVFSRRDKAIFAGLLLVTLPILPVLYIPAIAVAPMADRYLYLPSAGFALIMAAITGRVLALRKGRIVLVVFVIAAALYSWSTLKRSQVWKDDLTLWSVTARTSPESPIVHNNLGIELFYRGGVDEAISEYRRAIELYEPYPSAHYNLGNAYFYKGMTEEALFHYKRSVELEPDNVEAQHNLADIYLGKGMAAEAIYHYERFIEFAPPQYEEYRAKAREKVEMLRAGAR